MSVSFSADAYTEMMTEMNARIFREIRKLKEENEELKKKNKELKEENKTLKYKLEDTTCWEEFQEVMDKLQEDNKELKEQLDDIEKHPDYEDTITSTIEVAQKELKEDISVMHGDDEVQELNDEIEELKQELKVTREVEINGLCGYKTQIAELKEKSLHMQNYLETREVKYCEKDGCGRYCDEFADEISQRWTSPSVSGPGLEWICKECQEDKATSAGWPS